MNALVAEESIARMLPGEGSGRLIVVPRSRVRRRGWRALDADRIVAALEAGGTDAVVLVRDIEADPGAGALGQLARIMDREVVHLPSALAEAAWTVAVAAHGDFAGDGLVRRLEALVGEMRQGGPLPRRALAPGVAVPALRPAALSRWAGCAWRPCAVCRGGGPAGGRCGRCGARS